MNKMMKIRYIAQNISDLIKHIEETKENWNEQLEYRESRIKEKMEKEEPDRYDIKFAKDMIDEIKANQEAADEIIKYLEAYKF